MALEDAFEFLKDFGFFDVILPFILIFTLVFAILEKVKILGDKKNVNIVVALLFGAVGVASTYLTNFFNDFLPNVAITLVILFASLMLIKLLSPDLDLDVWYIQWIVPIVFVGLIIFQFNVESYLSLILQSPLFWGIVVIILIIWFITKGDGTSKSKKTASGRKGKEGRQDQERPSTGIPRDTGKYKLEKIGRVEGNELKEGYEKGGFENN